MHAAKGLSGEMNGWFNISTNMISSMSKSRCADVCT